MPWRIIRQKVIDFINFNYTRKYTITFWRIIHQGVPAVAVEIVVPPPVLVQWRPPSMETLAGPNPGLLQIVVEEGKYLSLRSRAPEGILLQGFHLVDPAQDLRLVGLDDLLRRHER